MKQTTNLISDNRQQEHTRTFLLIAKKDQKKQQMELVLKISYEIYENNTSMFLEIYIENFN